MTQPTFEPVSPPPRRNRRWRQILFIFSLLALASIGGGAWWIWVFVQEKLAPLVAENLGKELNRPVQMGRLERVSLTSMRFGPTSLPATIQDPDRAKVEAVEVQFDPWQILWNRRLQLYVNLIKPKAFIEQDDQGLWVSTKLQPPGEKGAIEVQLSQLRFTDAQVELLAQAKPGKKRKPSVQLKNINGYLNVSDANRRFSYELTGSSVAEGSFRISGESKKVTDQDLLSKLNLEGKNFLVGEIDRLIRLPVEITAGRVDGKVDVTLNPDLTFNLLGKATLKKVDLTSPGSPQPINQASGEIELENQTVRLKNVKAQFGSIPLVANGRIDPKSGFDLKANLPNVEIPQFIKTFKLKTPVPVTGNVSANVVMTGPVATPTISGSVENVGFITVDRLAIDKVNSQFRLDTSKKKLEIANLSVIPKVGGTITGGGTIGLDLPQTINLALQAKDVPGDAVVKVYNGQELSFQVGDINAQVIAKGNVNNIITTAIWEAPKATYVAKGEVVIRENGRRIDLRRLESQVYGGVVTATGQLIDRVWDATVNLGGVKLAQANPELRGVADGQIKLRGNLDNPSPKNITADGQMRLSEGISLITNQIDAQFNWDGQQINLKSATARGLDASGVIYADVEGTPEVTGIDLQVKASGIGLTALPLNLPAGVAIAGNANFEGRLVGTPSKPEIKGNLGLFDFGVNGIAFEPMQGTVDISSRRGLNLNVLGVTDRLTLNLDTQNQPIAVTVRRGNLSVIGKAQGELFNVALQEIPLNELSAFGITVPSLGGKLSGNASINLVRSEIPTAVVTIENPQFGEFPTVFQSQKIQTTLSYVGGVVKGNIKVNQPRFGTIESTDAVTNFVYANNVLRISDFVVQKGESRFAIAGSLDLRSTTPKLEGAVTVSKGRIEDILGAIQIFDLSDFSRGLSLPTYSNSESLANINIGAPSQSNVSLKTQLERLAEINTEIRQIARERKALVRSIPGEDRSEPLLPERIDVRGVFDSTIRFSTDAQGINIDKFEMQASNVEWRPFPGYAEIQKIGKQTKINQRDNQVLQAQSVLISATYKDGLLDLTRALAQIGEAQVNLQLNYGGENTSGQVTISRLPLTEIQKFYPSPVLLVGELNATASLGGSRENPNAGGQITLKEGAINGNPITLATGFFNYNRGRLNLDTTIKVDNPEPLKISGEIPLPIPFINVMPDNDDINLNINVKNEGLALLNLFNSPITWKDGQGQVNLTIGGKLLRPTANGEISLQNASFLTQGLPEPLTNVNGSIRFDQDRIRVESLKGEFSQGNILARGSLPLFSLLASLPIPLDVSTQGCLSDDANQPLNVEMNRIKLSYKGLYQGSVQGCINVAGNIFKPRITGEITLSNGQVLLSDEIQNPAAIANSGNAANPTVNPGGGNLAENTAGLEFDNLRLTLGNGIQVVRAPILNFVAQGTLTVNGTLNAPQPNGKILLRSGQVNIFTTQFVLVRGYSHSAIFTPAQGLDPLLDVRMIASVPEITRSPINSSQALTSEVSDSPLFATNLGSLQTVRIQAKVTGQASQLFDNLELTSSPNRSQNEIIGLLGGGFINTLGRGDSTLGIANLAGSALLTNIQGFIGNALNLSEFRLFPTISNDQEKRTSTLGLAAEIGVDITPSISLSLSKILTSDQFPQLGLRYRINDNFLFRGSTDFFGDNRAVVEYETRF